MQYGHMDNEIQTFLCTATHYCHVQDGEEDKITCSICKAPQDNPATCYNILLSTVSTTQVPF